MLRMALAVVALAACGGRPTATHVRPPGADGGSAQQSTADVVAAPPIIGVALVVTPPEASVAIDDVERGPASKLAGAIALEPGLHWMIVQLDGYEPYRAEFTVSDKTERFTVRLKRAR
jgi:hypothetical protein